MKIQFRPGTGVSGGAREGKCAGVTGTSKVCDLPVCPVTFVGEKGIMC